MNDCLSRLQPGHIVFHAGEKWRVTMVNDCRAQITPIEKRHTEVIQIIDGKETVVAKFNKTGAAINISPNSFIDIIGYEKPAIIVAPAAIQTPTETTAAPEVQRDLPGDHNGPGLPKRRAGRPKKSSR